jgi:hypothetical protein
MTEFISDTKQYIDLLQTMQIQFNQLDKLKLLNFKRAKNLEIVLYDEEKPEEIKRPEVIFILANHNPRSPKLSKILSNPEFDKYEQSKLFDLRFYVSSFAGYGLHADNMRTLAEFRKLAEVKKRI